MSDLNPKGVSVQVNGEERRLLFTLNVVDRIQSEEEANLLDVIKGLGNEKTINRTIKYLMYTLLEDESDRVKALEGRDLKRYTEQELGWIITAENLDEYVSAVLRAYGISMPENDEEDDDDPNS